MSVPSHSPSAASGSLRPNISTGSEPMWSDSSRRRRRYAARPAAGPAPFLDAERFLPGRIGIRLPVRSRAAQIRDPAQQHLLHFRCRRTGTFHRRRHSEKHSRRLSDVGGYHHGYADRCGGRYAARRAAERSTPYFPQRHLRHRLHLRRTDPTISVCTSILPAAPTRSSPPAR